MKTKELKPFLWIPGEGCDSAALFRMYDEFPRPRQPMGEAWFMGDSRRMFDKTDSADAGISRRDVCGALFEIASGARSFGQRREWTEWFHYLLADELPGAMYGVVEAPLVEALATAYFALYPKGVERELYKGFARDSLDTLGRSIMNAHCWSQGRIVRGEILQRNPRWWGASGWDEASGDLSASMFFCLKYLASAQIEPWLRSAFAIEDRYWRAQVMVWFVGAHDMLTGVVDQPSQFSDAVGPCISWENCHVLTGVYEGVTTEAAPAPFLPRANREAALTAVAHYFDETAYFDWLCAFAEDEALEVELADIPDRFHDLYMPPQRLFCPPEA